MDVKIFWLIVFVLIGATGAILTAARRYKNEKEPDAGYGIAGWTVVFLFIWLLAGLSLLG